MTNPYEAPSTQVEKNLASEKRRLSFSRRTAIVIWLLGFGLQLAAYLSVIAVLVLDVGQPYSDNPSTAEVEFNPDLAQVLFNITIALLGLVAIYAIAKCHDFTPEFKWAANGASAVLFCVCWLGFMFTAVAIAFSGGFQGE